MSKKIIIGDDSSAFLMYTGMLLKRFDYKVLPADSGIEVMKLMKLTHADAILMDVHMRDLDGVSVLRHIRGDRHTSHVPVIMVSVDGSSETIETCRKLGCFDYLVKPLKIDVLHGCLQRCFFSHKGTDRKRLRAEFHGRIEVICQGRPETLYSETISEGGIFLRTRNPYPVGTEIELIVPLAKKDQKLRVLGKVIYIKELFGDYLLQPPGMAVEFSNITPDDQIIVKRLIEDIIAGDLIDSQDEKVIER